MKVSSERHIASASGPNQITGELELENEVRELITRAGGSPFLFIGSGFSRRYIGLEDWRGLLSKFCEDLNDFEYYLASANGKLEKAASLMAADFHKVWWKHEKFSNSRESYKHLAIDVNSALKIEISNYLRDLNIEDKINREYTDEINLIKSLNVDGIITTNWDQLLEELFPEYKVYVGQGQLLFSNPQSIAEIYKIHGSVEDPHSLVLTEDDYKEFDRKNPYLVAKLITIFIEHPIIFIGYAVNDPHISDLIFEIASCLSDEKLDDFSKNLIFLRRSNGAGDLIETVNFARDGRALAATVLKTDDFSKVYAVIAEKKRKIPARILRYCKEQMFELVRSSNPDEKLAVVDIDELDQKEDVEFVVGVGVAASKRAKADEAGAQLADAGYHGLERKDIFRDLLRADSEFDAKKLLRSVYPKLRRVGTFHPIYRYLRAAGIDSEEALGASEFEDAKIVFRKMCNKPLTNGTYRGSYLLNHAEKSAEQIVADVGAEKSANFLGFLDEDRMPNEWLRTFLIEHFDHDFRDPYASTFNKLMCLYDRRVYGFEKITHP